MTNNITHAFEQNNDGYLMEEQYRQDVSETEEDKDQMNRHANAKRSLQMPGYHSDEMELDNEVLDQMTHHFIQIIYLMTGAEEIDGNIIFDPTLEYQARFIADNLIRQGEYMAKRADVSAGKLLARVQYLERTFEGTEIDDKNLQDAENTHADVRRQADNLRKHWTAAAIQAWDEVIKEPRSTGKDNDGQNNNVTMARMKARDTIKKWSKAS
ncbi:MAG: hypothetical protein VW498_02100 [Candidatus Thalassarchaeaceae archaeon]